MKGGDKDENAAKIRLVYQNLSRIKVALLKLQDWKEFWSYASRLEPCYSGVGTVLQAAI